jgi:hypothetical protein
MRRQKGKGHGGRVLTTVDGEEASKDTLGEGGAGWLKA